MLVQHMNKIIAAVIDTLDEKIEGLDPQDQIDTIEALLDELTLKQEKIDDEIIDNDEAEEDDALEANADGE